MPEGDEALRDLYRDVLLDYFRDGSHKGSLANADVRSHGVNPVCGDEVVLTLKKKGPRIETLRHDGHGCVISQSSSAMLAQILEGKTVDEALGLVAAFKTMMVGGASPDGLPDALEEVRALEGVRQYPVRVKCALLAWNTFLEGFKSNIKVQ